MKKQFQFFFEISFFLKRNHSCLPSYSSQTGFETDFPVPRLELGLWCCRAAVRCQCCCGPSTAGGRMGQEQGDTCTSTLAGLGCTRLERSMPYAEGWGCRVVPRVLGM